MMPSFPQSPAPFFTGVLQGSPQASSAAGTCQSDTVTVAWQHSVCSPFSHVRLSFFYCGLLIIYPLRIVRNLEVSSVLFCCWAETSHCQDNELWGELISGDLRDWWCLELSLLHADVWISWTSLMNTVHMQKSRAIIIPPNLAHMLLAQRPLVFIYQGPGLHPALFFLNYHACSHFPRA